VDVVSTDLSFMSDDDQAELLVLLVKFFDRWQELHRVIPTGDRPKMEAASLALVDQASKVRAFYGD
jgi:hypothetical protein